MSLPQLIGLDCVTCRNRIGSVADATFCEECGNPVHMRCLERDGVPSDVKCPICGGDPDSRIAKEVRRERIAEIKGVSTPVAPPGYFPVSKICPKCDCAEYDVERPIGWVAFAWDRVCKECGTRYTPPTRLWAAVTFLVVGLALSGIGAVGLAAGDICVALLGLLGILRSSREFAASAGRARCDDAEANVARNLRAQSGVKRRRVPPTQS